MSRPPEHPDSPSDSWADNPPPGYETPPGYGAPTPPPGYPPAPGQPFSIGDAFSWAWNKFSNNTVPLVVSILLYSVIGGVLYGLVFVLLGNATTTSNPEGAGGSFYAGLGTTGSIVLQLVSYAFGIFAGAASMSGLLDIADGRPVTIGSFFKPRNFGAVILAALLVGFFSAIGYVLCFIPGLVFTFLAMFTIAFVIDRSLPPFEALKASIATVRSDVGSALLSWLVQFLVVLAGVLACGVGALVGAPVALLIQVYTYRRLSGGSIAPLTA
jgi:uncharacterized membrane protein